MLLLPRLVSSVSRGAAPGEGLPSRRREFASGGETSSRGLASGRSAPLHSAQSPCAADQVKVVRPRCAAGAYSGPS